MTLLQKVCTHSFSAGNFFPNSFLITLQENWKLQKGRKVEIKIPLNSIIQRWPLLTACRIFVCREAFLIPDRNHGLMAMETTAMTPLVPSGDCKPTGPVLPATFLCVSSSLTLEGKVTWNLCCQVASFVLVINFVVGGFQFSVSAPCSKQGE